MKIYGWALNSLKLQRAIAKAGAEATEDQVKVEYEAIGGLVNKEYEAPLKETNAETTTEAPKVKKAKSSK